MKLDGAFLEEVGIAGLEADDAAALLELVYSTLEYRVGLRLAKGMSDEMLTEFEGFMDEGNEAGALHWLEENVPDYKAVVAEEFGSLKNEIRERAPEFVNRIKEKKEDPA